MKISDWEGIPRFSIIWMFGVWLCITFSMHYWYLMHIAFEDKAVEGIRLLLLGFKMSYVMMLCFFGDYIMSWIIYFWKGRKIKGE